MANSMTPNDVYSVVNAINSQMFGKTEISAVDTTTFVSVGETMLRSGTENVMNAMAQVYMTNYFPSMTYRGKLQILEESNERWGGIMMETIPLHQDSEASTDTNTNLSPNQFDDGNSIDHYKINKPKVKQLRFYGTKKLQSHLTRLNDQLAQAFRSESEFASFWNSIMTEWRNDIEQYAEAGRRATLCNFIAGISNMGLYEIDMTKEFNDAYGTAYTGKALRTTHAEEFLKFFVAKVAYLSDCMTERSYEFHMNFTGADIPRFTPKNYQRFIMFNGFWQEAKANVLPTVFNDKYLKIDGVEYTNYWQSFKDPEQISIKPNIIDTNGVSKNGTQTDIPYVLGTIFDRRAIGVNHQYNKTLTTPVNAAGDYFNTYVHFRENYWNNFTHNAIVFVMGEGS